MSSESDADNISICIWTYEEKKLPKQSRRVKKVTMFGTILIMLVQLILLACACMLLFQNKVSVSLMIYSIK